MHLGLEPAHALAAKYEQSARNFARLVGSHGETVTSYTTYRLARVLKRMPGGRVLQSLFKSVALNKFVPLRTRMAVMLAFRAAVYSEVV